MFYYFGIGLSLFLILLLITKSNKTTADVILTVWLSVIASHLFLYSISLQQVTLNNIHQLGLALPFPFLHGPLLYLYTAVVTGRLPVIRKQSYWHFLPAVLIVCCLFPSYALSAAEKMTIYNNGGRDFQIFFLIHGILMQLSGVIYTGWSFKLLREHRKKIGHQFSYEERIYLNWLTYLSGGLLLLWAIIILGGQDYLIFGGTVFFVTLIGFLGIKQVGIFDNTIVLKAAAQTTAEPVAGVNTVPVENDLISMHVPAMAEPELKGMVETKKKYANSGLTQETRTEVHERLSRLMLEDELYTDPELSLNSLAARLQIHPNYLSQTINELEGKTFFDYVNTLRVHAFIRLMDTPSSNLFTIIGLAYDCGFNSKSSFNKNFKKITGQSPSGYFKRNIKKAD